MKLATFTFEVMPEFVAGGCSKCIFNTYKYMDEDPCCYLQYNSWNCPLEIAEKPETGLEDGE